MANDLSLHPSLDLLIDYAEGTLPEDEGAGIELHLAECNDCAGLARSTREVCEAMRLWTAETHALAMSIHENRQRQMVAIALRRAEKEATGSVRERLNVWREKLRAQAGAAVRIVLDAQQEATRVITEGVEGLLMPEPRWRFVYDLPPVRVRGTGGKELPPTVVKSTIPGVEISVQHEANEILVKLPPALQAQSPLVLLVGDGDVPPLLGSRAISRPGQPYSEIKFTRVPHNAYTLVVEPAA
jgi:hypothetical protein